MSSPAASSDYGFGHCAVWLGNLVRARGEAALAPLDMTLLDYEVMLCIRDSEGLSQQELSRKLGLYAQKMVGFIDGLEQRGRVERQVSPVDRRRHMLRLTAEGSALLDRAVAAAKAVEEEMFGCVSEADRARFQALVERLDAEATAARG